MISDPLDVFISYRRKNGFYQAKVIKELLTKRGLNVFWDIECLNAEDYSEQIVNAISQAPIFVVILSPNALTDCVNEKDWIRKEVTEAINTHSTIIPVLCEGFSFPKKWKEDMPQEIRSLETRNGVLEDKMYLEAMIDKLISLMGTLPESRLNINKGTINIAVSIMTTVVDSIILGCECDQVFERIGYSVKKIRYQWSDRILDDLNSGKLDLSIYNKQSCLNYNEAHNGKIHIVRDLCSAMGGRNFYILARKDSRWTGMTLEQFKNSLDENTKIGVERKSDMYKDLLYILDMSEEELISEKKVTVFDYQSSHGLSLFSAVPDLLIIATQSLRFVAEKTGEYIEVISYDNLPAGKREFLFENSINSLMLGPSGMEKLRGLDVEKIVIDLMLNFYKNLLNKESSIRIKKLLAEELSSLCEDQATLDSIIDNIIFESFRLM